MTAFLRPIPPPYGIICPIIHLSYHLGDLAVGAPGDDDGGTPPFAERGAVWVLLLKTNGTVKSSQKISDTDGTFLEDFDQFGFAVTGLGDLDGDQVVDLAASAEGDDDGEKRPTFDRGAVWVLFLNDDGTVKSLQKISDIDGNFTGVLDNGDEFGQSLASLGDIDGDCVRDLAVGADGDDDGGMSLEAERGAVWVLFHDEDGTVKFHQKISDTEGNFTGALDDHDDFGESIAWLGDLNGDGMGDLAVGASEDDDGGEDRGAVWILFLEGAPACRWGCVNGDGEIGIEEFLAVLGLWGTGHVDEPCDFDCDGEVGINEFLKVLGVWGPCP